MREILVEKLLGDVVDDKYILKENYTIDDVDYEVDIKEERSEGKEETIPDVYISKGITPLISCDYDELCREMSACEDLPEKIRKELEEDKEQYEQNLFIEDI